ncbi:MAG: aspartate/glutamate racemase family protein, partial [Candidatus Ornithospirochaeta sp.]
EVELTNVVDEILISNTQKKGEFTKWNMDRLLSDLSCAEEEDSDLIVVTCSSLTPYVLALGDKVRKPIVTIDKKMCSQAAEKGTRILVLATASTTVGPTVARIKGELEALGKKAEVYSSLRSDAMAALKKDDVAAHDRILTEEAVKYPECDLIVLAQASMASAKESVEEATGKMVLTSPDSCISEVLEFYGKA